MKFDVSVVGAGPGGLAAAICCAEAGLKVCVLERSSFPRPCVGEAVHPGAEALFHRLGVATEIADARFLRYAGIWVSCDGKKHFKAFGEGRGQHWAGFQLWRPDLDLILLNRAKMLGVVCFEHCCPSHIEMINRKVRIHSKVGEVESAVVVDGTGRNRWIARQWRLKVESHSRPLIAHYGYREGYCASVYENPLFVQRQGGWDWFARVREDLYQWISLSSEANKRNHLPRWFVDLRQASSSLGADVTWRFVTDCAGPQYFLVGDASAVLDPSGSHGMIKALASGILAATCIQEVLGEGFKNNDRIVQGYIKWQRKWFERDSSILRHLNKWAEVA